MADAGTKDVARMRAAFFSGTRRMVGVLYGGLALGAALCALAAFLDDVLGAIIALAVGFIAAVVLFALSPLIPVSAKAARVLVLASGVGGALLATLVDWDGLAGQAVLAGGFAGFLAGMIVGIAAIRRRLAQDDELFLRQRRLGVDPERPWAWLESHKD